MQRRDCVKAMMAASVSAKAMLGQEAAQKPPRRRSLPRPQLLFPQLLFLAHADIRQATTNSQAWSDAARAKGQSPHTDLYWYPIDPNLRRDGFAPTHRPTPAHRPA